MKTWARKLTMAVASAVALAVPFAAVPAAHAAGATISITPSYPDPSKGPVASEALNVRANFNGRPTLSLWSDVTGAAAVVRGQTAKKSNSSGVYTFTYRPVKDQNVWVQNDADSSDRTRRVAIKLAATSAILNAIQRNSTGTSATATATFKPARSGQKTELQALTIKTAMTNEMPGPRWRTIATSKQTSSGATKFTLSNPLEVTHAYRAITRPSGGSVATISNTVTFAAARASKHTGLPTVYLDTNEGASINTRSRYFEGQFEMTAGAGCGAAPRQLVAAKGRGNYSWTFAKKSFTIKLDKKADLCGMGKSKKWALVANAYDKSLLRNSIANYVGSKMTNLAWTPKSKPVDLYINGSYRGSYILIERVAVAENRVDVPELDSSSTNNSGGYLLEWDYRKGADYNVTAGSRGWVGIKEPEKDLDPAGHDTHHGITKAQRDYINSYLDATDRALFGRNFTSDSSGWKKYIDEKSAVDYYIAMELMKPVDGNMWASVYMYKQANGKLFFGPLWDFDLAAGSARRAGNTVSPTGWYLRKPVATSARQSSVTWFNRLNQDPQFRSAVRARWKQVYPNLRTTTTFIDREKSAIHKSADANFKKWSVTQHLSSVQVVKGSWTREVSYVRSWMASRISWMNRQY
jgi:hypothetical protein